MRAESGVGALCELTKESKFPAVPADLKGNLRSMMVEKAELISRSNQTARHCSLERVMFVYYNIENSGVGSLETKGSVPASLWRIL